MSLPIWTLLLGASVLTVGTSSGLTFVKGDDSLCTDEILVSSDNKLSPQYSDLTQCGVWSRAVTVSDAYGADVTVQSMDLEIGDYVTINAGETRVTDTSAALFAGSVRTPRTFRIPSTNKVYIEFTSTERSAVDRLGFSITFQPYGMITTPSPSTTDSALLRQCVDFPVPQDNATDEYTVYVKSQVSFDDENIVDHFKLTVQEAAASFYNKELHGNITVSDVCVGISYITRCPYGWPDWETCYQVLMSVPVNDTDSNNYELTPDHIQKMWYEVYGLEDPRFQVYNVPDTDGTFTTWLICSLGVIVVFTLVLFGWRLLYKGYFMITSKDSDSQIRMSIESHRKDSWIEEDMPYQDIPTSYMDEPLEYEPEYQHTKNVTFSDHTIISPMQTYKPALKPPQEFGAGLRFGPLSIVNEIAEGEEEEVYSRTKVM